MNEQNLIYDWNVINWELNRDDSKHPHKVWFDDETLRAVSYTHLTLPTKA